MKRILLSSRRRSSWGYGWPRWPWCGRCHDRWASSSSSSSSSSPSAAASQAGVVTDKSRFRNIGIIAHVDAGKTTLTERMLHYTGETRHLGNVDSGSTVTDFLDLERERGITIQSAAASMRWRDFHINLVDTPGHVDFTLEVERSIRVLDGGVTVLDAVSGVQAQTETVWRQAQRYGVPCIAVLNKMDKDGANPEHAMATMRDRLTDCLPVLTQMPLGEGAAFRGVVDLVSWPPAVLRWRDETGTSVSRHVLSEESMAEAEAARSRGEAMVGGLDDVNADVWSRALGAREAMLECLADVDVDVLEAVVTQGVEVSGLLVRRALRKAVLEQRCVPVLLAAAFRNRGVQPVLDAVCQWLPSPLDTKPPRVFPCSESIVQLARSGAGNTKRQRRGEAGPAAAPEPAVEVDGICGGGGDDGTPIPVTDEGPLVALAFKVIHDPHAGLIVFFRVYSGRLRSGATLINTTSGQKERVLRVLRIQGNDSTSLKELCAGDIGAAVGLKNTSTGDTLVGSSDALVRVPGITVAPPVFFCAIEPESTSVQDSLNDALNLLHREDPSFQVSFHEETGQQLISGMGELHLDTIYHRLTTHYGIRAEMGPIQIAYHSTLQPGTVDAVHTGVYALDGVDVLVRVRMSAADLGSGVHIVDGREVPLVVSADRAKNRASEQWQAVADVVSQGLRTACESGFRFGVPLTDVHVVIEEISFGGDAEAVLSVSLGAIGGGLRGAAAASMRAAGAAHDMYLLEPMMTVEVEVPSEHYATVVSDLTQGRRGMVMEVDGDEAGRKVLSAQVPLQAMLGYSNHFRSLTHGHGSYSMELAEYQPVADRHQAAVLQKLRGW